MSQGGGVDVDTRAAGQRQTVGTGPLAIVAGTVRFMTDLVRERRAEQAHPPAPGAVPETDFDPLLPAALVDPYPHYRRLLAEGPVHYNRAQDLWIVSGYAAVRAALRADEVFSSRHGVQRFRMPLPMMLSLDRPEHTRLRALVSGEFARAGVDRWLPVIDELCGQLVGAMARRGRSEVVDDLAVPLPVEVISRILGVPVADRDRFRRWSNKLVLGLRLRAHPRDLPDMVRTTGALVSLRRYLDRQVSDRRAAPDDDRDDLLGRLMAGTRGGGPTGTGEAPSATALSDDELFWFVLLLLVAGNETTTNLLSTLVHNLAHHPDQYELLRSRPELIGSAIEEQLRLGSPIQGLHRTALRDHPVVPGGPVVPAGARVLVLYAAANRDPAHFPDPDSFRIDRNPTDHLAFGSGIHYCLGAYLSRLEAHRAVAELVEKVARIEPDGPHRWSRNPGLRGLTRLPVRLVPAH